MKEKKDRVIAVLLGANIAARRKAQGMPQAVFADRLGITSDSLSRIERGSVVPRLHRIQEIASLLDCTVSDLFKTPGETLVSVSEHQGTDTPVMPSDILSELRYMADRIVLLTRMLESSEKNMSGNDIS